MSESESHLGKDGTLIGTLLVRAVIPAFVIFGAAMKFASASPASLPTWIQAVVDSAASSEASGETIFIWVLRGVLSVEVIAAGIMLFVPRLARMTAAAILTVFMFVLVAEFSFLMRTGLTFTDALSGSCGCFGNAVTVPLWAEFALNAVLLAGVVFFKPFDTPLRATPKWGIALLLVWLVVAGQFSVRANFPPEEDRGWQRMQPMYWVGRHYDETALFDFVVDADFSFYDMGLPQTWVLYRRSCPVCHNLFEEHFSGEITDRVVVAVEVPPDPGLATDGVEDRDVICPACQFTQLVDSMSWLVSTPLVIEFDENGIVTKVTDPRIEDFGRSKDEI